MLGLDRLVAAPVCGRDACGCVCARAEVAGAGMAGGWRRGGVGRVPGGARGGAEGGGVRRHRGRGASLRRGQKSHTPIFFFGLKILKATFFVWLEISILAKCT